MSVPVRAVFHFLKPAVLLSSSRSVDKSCRSVLIYKPGAAGWGLRVLSVSTAAAQGEQPLQGQRAALAALVKKTSHTGTAKGASAVRKILLQWGKKIPFSKNEKKKNLSRVY